jgi:hypothetical protein
VYDLAGELSQEVVSGSCPSPAEANAVAERVLNDWAYTDGGN